MIHRHKFISIFILFGIFLSLPAKSQNSKSPLLDSWEKYQDHKANTLFNMKWIQLGPVVNSARAEAVQGDPSKPGTGHKGP